MDLTNEPSDHNTTDGSLEKLRLMHGRHVTGKTAVKRLTGVKGAGFRQREEEKESKSVVDGAGEGGEGHEREQGEFPPLEELVVSTRR